MDVDRLDRIAAPEMDRVERLPEPDEILVVGVVAGPAAAVAVGAVGRRGDRAEGHVAVADHEIAGRVARMQREAVRRLADLRLDQRRDRTARAASRRRRRRRPSSGSRAPRGSARRCRSPSGSSARRHAPLRAGRPRRCRWAGTAIVAAGGAEPPLTRGAGRPRGRRGGGRPSLPGGQRIVHGFIRLAEASPPVDRRGIAAVQRAGLPSGTLARIAPGTPCVFSIGPSQA